MFNPLRSILRSSAALLCMVLLGLSLAGCRSPSEAEIEGAQLSGATMGTTWNVRLTDLPGGTDRLALTRQIEQALDSVNAGMSNWRDDSELSLFNSSTSTDWFPVSRETATVVSEAQRISRLSGGAFDVTVAPLVGLWSFGPEAGPPAVPSAAALERVRQRVGYTHLEARLDPPALRKTQPDLSVDLSAIAKGFGVDHVAHLLDELGAEAYMVEIGGEVRTRGLRGDGTPWRIGIEAPIRGRRTLHRVIRLSDASMATSGDYRSFVEIDGQEYSHTIDPRTGRPARHRLGSVSVIADSCMEADGLATTLMVLGPEAGYEWASENQIAALLIERHEDGTFTEQATPAFSRYESPARAAPPAAENSATGEHAASDDDDQGGLLPILLASGAVFLIAFAGMAAGVIFSNRRLKGSCGGLAGMRDEDGGVQCESCGTPSPDCSGEPAEAGRTAPRSPGGNDCSADTAEGEACGPEVPAGCPGDQGDCTETECPLSAAVAEARRTSASAR